MFYPLRYRFYDLPRSVYTKPVWKNVNPKIEERTRFSAFTVSHDFLNYLQKNALIVDLWGLQGISLQCIFFICGCFLWLQLVNIMLQQHFRKAKAPCDKAWPANLQYCGPSVPYVNSESLIKVYLCNFSIS